MFILKIEKGVENFGTLKMKIYRMLGSLNDLYKKEIEYTAKKKDR